MALQRDNRYPGRYEPSSPQQPQGAFKNRTTDTSQDGSYLERDWLNDFSALFSSILDYDNVSPDGNVDEVGNSQYFNSLLSIFSPPKTIVISSNQNYIPSSNARAAKITVVGGGGGAGGVDGQGAGTSALTVGGGGGGFSIRTLTTLESSYSISIGAGGIGGSAGANAGSDGGSTTITGNDSSTLLLEASGGKGSPGSTGGTVITFGGVLGGVGTLGDVNGSGTPSTAAIANGGVRGSLSTSGSCPVIGGGKPASINANGFDATSNGEGGGAASSQASTSNYSGGDGFGGICIIEEYF